ncbi:hypothetical protein RHGRI_013843 [Rhododendron griersonianum]|uniref:Uncharacterized protein n=1 Tax=Rhododendron griersonianum TaxID=479676 RepID=A0AAV6K751_9ERIC|nr:hypothetical protein RHGRI_013843 [Rhododendron griersonianum]
MEKVIVLESIKCYGLTLRNHWIRNQLHTGSNFNFSSLLPVVRPGNASSKYRSLWCRLRKFFSGVSLPEAQRQSMSSFLRDTLHQGKELLSCTIQLTETTAFTRFEP